MLRSTMCSDWLISLLACSSGNLKLVAVLVLAIFAIVWFTWYDLTSYSIVLPVSISALFFRLWIICYRCILYARFTLYFCERFSCNSCKLYFCSFTIVYLNCYDVTSYSIVLPVSISALVFRLCSICFRCIINAGYFGYFIGMKVYRVCTSFD